MSRTFRTGAQHRVTFQGKRVDMTYLGIIPGLSGLFWGRGPWLYRTEEVTDISPERQPLAEPLDVPWTHNPFGGAFVTPTESQTP